MIRDEVIEEGLQGYSSPQDLLGGEGLFNKLKKRLLERALGAELSEHLGCEKGDPAGRGSGNNRNGYSAKAVLGCRIGSDSGSGAARPPGQLRTADRAERANPVPAGDPQDDLHDERGGSLNRSLRKIIKTRGSFPTDEAAPKLLFLVIRNCRPALTPAH